MPAHSDCSMSRLQITFSVTLALMLAGVSPVAHSQCSCGGPPLLSSLETPATSAGVWQFGLTYEYSAVGDFVTGTTELPDDIRDRTVQSGVFQLDYGLTDRVTLGAMFTWLQQDRTTVTQTGANSEFFRTRGVGDAIFLLKYIVLPYSPLAQRQLSIGAGFKAPIGKTSLLNPNGSLAAADMQPGAGALDAVFWASGSLAFLTSKRASAFASATYRLTGTNKDFQGGYRFGNDLLTSAGVGYALSAKLTPTVGLRYRHAGAQERINNVQPNSGGNWINLTPGLNATINESWSARVNGQIPVYRDLEGTQFTTSYSVAFSLFFKIGPKPRSDFQPASTNTNN